MKNLKKKSLGNAKQNEWKFKMTTYSNGNISKEWRVQIKN